MKNSQGSAGQTIDRASNCAKPSRNVIREPRKSTYESSQGNEIHRQLIAIYAKTKPLQKLMRPRPLLLS